MDNTKLLQRINELGKELNLDNLCELKRLYSDLEQKAWNSDNQVEANSYVFLMHEISYTLFDMLKSKNDISNNESIRKMVKSLNMQGLMVDDLVSVNNHVFVVGESIRDFGRKEKATLIDDYLKEIKEVIFEEDERKTISSDKLYTINMVLNSLNNELLKLNLDCKNDYPYLFMDDSKLCYNTPNLHIYLSNSLLDIANTIVNGLSKDIEIIIEDNAKNYYVLNMKIINHKYSFEEDKADMWSLQDTLNPKTKYLKKV